MTALSIQCRWRNGHRVFVANHPLPALLSSVFQPLVPKWISLYCIWGPSSPPSLLLLLPPFTPLSKSLGKESGAREAEAAGPRCVCFWKRSVGFKSTTTKGFLADDAEMVSLYTLHTPLLSLSLATVTCEHRSVFLLYSDTGSVCWV